MSTKKNIQAFREWAYENKAFKKEDATAATVINSTLNSKQRNYIKWQSSKNKTN